MSTIELQEQIEGVPNVSGAEGAIEKSRGKALKKPAFLPESDIDFANLKSAFACALHMHQPQIPNPDEPLESAGLINNLQHMMSHQDIGDNHNAPAFVWCYKRIGEFVPQLVNEGASPRIMLEYSGTLFHGLRQMGQDDVFDALKEVTCNPAYRKYVEWLGCPWGHAVTPSTPVIDYRWHVKAWQNHFAAIFGMEALDRVRGFSPSEMALPNHPDVAHEYIKTLNECGYQWLLVQEHSVELPESGHHPELRHLPHRLVCKDSHGGEQSIICFIKTQGSDTKLVAQMQPFYEAQSLNRSDWSLDGQNVPPIVSQIADGENGGVMMNEFPDKFFEAMRAASHGDTRAMGLTEYLEHLMQMGVKASDLPVVQPVKQKALWERVEPGCGAEKMEKAIEELKKESHEFHMDGGSWTNDISWVKGYDDVLTAMERASAVFNQKVFGKKSKIDTESQAFRNALYHLMCSQTSCYRYWGQGEWTDYGREICRRAEEIVKHDF